jgi:hypothetical protein
VPPGTINDRNEADLLSPMGIATTRTVDRVLATTGSGHATPMFEAHDGIAKGGLMFLVPALLLQGLLTASEVYTMPSAYYYDLDSILLTLAFMALARIQNPEQLKQCKPGEIGRIMGLDRIPEVRCLREKIRALSKQGQSQELNNKLINHWYCASDEGEQEASFFYIDGHVRVYSGALATLPIKFVSRQKLCLSATTEFWVNDEKGLPVMMVMGELTEKLQQAIEEQIIGRMQQAGLLPVAPPAADAATATAAQPVATEDITPASPQEEKPVCTLIFDREGYDIPFINRMWKKYRVASLTYRKNVKDEWARECFKSADVTESGNVVTMNICEKKITLGGTQFREIRRLTASGHQTSIITNNSVITTEQAAGRMFSRWCQENFFRYMKSDYSLDKMIEFGIEPVEQTREVVNPKYRKLTALLKKEKLKTRKLNADNVVLIEQYLDATLELLPKLERKLYTLAEQLGKQEFAEKQIADERSKTPARITVKDMPGQSRYNKLKSESKMFINIIKMICYRAETAIANLLTAYDVKEEEKRMVVKQIINNNADILPDLENNTLTITLHSLSAPRFNVAACKLAALLNETDVNFPNTNLRLVFKCADC